MMRRASSARAALSRGEKTLPGVRRSSRHAASKASSMTGCRSGSADVLENGIGGPPGYQRRDYQARSLTNSRRTGGDASVARTFLDAKRKPRRSDEATPGLGLRLGGASPQKTEKPVTRNDGLPDAITRLMRSGSTNGPWRTKPGAPVMSSRAINGLRY